jgi:DNA polymerase-1
MLMKEAGKHTLSGFNLSGFDTRFCRRDGMAWAVTRDVMLKAFLVNENEPRNVGYGLEALANRYLGEEHTIQQRELHHLLVSKLLGKGDICVLPAKLVAPYACEDVELSDKLDAFYDGHIERQKLRSVWHGVSEYGQLVGLMCERGLPINTEQCEEELQRARCMVTETAMEVYQREGHVVSINSNPAAARWLGVTSTKEDDLQAMKDSMGDAGWKIELLLKYRKLQRAISSYYGPMLADTDEEGRLHPNIALHGTVTGRPACWSGRGHMNVLALPRDTKTYRVKQCIEAPEGQLFIQADYRTAEMRLACHYGQEKRMAALLMAGKNIHRVTSDDLKMPYDSAKRVNFSVIYGIGAPALAENLHIDVKTAARYLRAYHKRYPGFRRLYRDAERKARQTGRIRMWTGRLRHYNRGPVTPHHKASDHLIQGGVNELLRIKQTQLHHELSDVEQVLQVYDSAIMLVPENVAYERAEQVREIMTHDGFTLPMEVDILIGKTLAKSENDT